VTEADGTAAVAVPMLSLRFCANCFRGGPGSLKAVSDLLARHVILVLCLLKKVSCSLAHFAFPISFANSVLSCAEGFVLSKNKNVRISVATVLMNVAISVSTTLDAQDASIQVVSLVDKLLACKLYESEATVRALLALGTVVLAKEVAREAARSLHLTTKVEPAASPHGDTAKAVAKEIYFILS
jgi:hypothetical protein